MTYSRSLWLCLLLFFSFTAALRVHESVRANKGTIFLAKFCAEKNENNTHDVHLDLKVKLNKPNTSTGLDLQILLLDDTRWDKVKDKDCDEIRKEANEVTLVGTGTQEKKIIFSESEAHYWYAVASKCSKSDKKYDIDITLHFKNSPGWWTREFSYDQFGLAQLYLTYMLLFLLFLLVHGFFVFIQWKAKRLTPTNRLFTMAMILKWIGYLSLFIHLGIFADDGMGAPGVEGFGEIVNMCAELLFMGMLILLASGWTATTTKLHGKKVLLAVLCVLLLAYMGFFIWQNVGLEDSETINEFVSAPGIVILVLRCLTWFFVIYCMVMTIHFRKDTTDEGSEERRRKLLGMENAGQPLGAHNKLVFFIVFGTVASLWLLSLPLIVCVSLAAADFHQVLVTNTIYSTTSFLIFILFSVWYILSGRKGYTGAGLLSTRPLQDFNEDDADVFQNVTSAGGSTPYDTL